MTTRLRDATGADLETIRAIYNHYVGTSTCTYQTEPDTAEERLAWFSGRTEAHPVIVAEDPSTGEVVAWASLSPWNRRAGYRHTVEASFYVHHDHHRRGIGRAMVREMIDRARSCGHHAIIGGASADQFASIALQESMGFERVALFREVGHKFGRWLDVVYMQLLL
jgi:phosphinothricin acetyltransferase